MGKNIGVLSCQFEPYIGNRDKNLEKVDELIGQYGDKNIDLVLVPEFFTTGIPKDGFIPEEEKTSYTLDFMKNLAKKYKTNICCGSIIEKEHDKLYNTTYFIDRSGDVTGKYRKIHLFSYFGGNEHLSITKGDKIVVVEADFGVVGKELERLREWGADMVHCDVIDGLFAPNITFGMLETRRNKSFYNCKSKRKPCIFYNIIALRFNRLGAFGYGIQFNYFSEG